MDGRIEKNEGRLFRRPKFTLSCSAEGKEGINTSRYCDLFVPGFFNQVFAFRYCFYQTTLSLTNNTSFPKAENV
jgi:hypothetical protein